jgi:hypothetical protein
MDHLDLFRRQADLLDLEPCQRVRDRDDLRRPPRKRALDEAEGTCAKRIVVVLRRHEPARAESSVDVRMHEMGVHEICLPHDAAHAHAEHRVEVSRGRDPHERNSELLVKGVRRTSGIVEPEERDVDAALGERRQQGQQMALGPADAADPVDVENLHRDLRRARPSAHSSAPAASSAMRKSVETR